MLKSVLPRLYMLFITPVLFIACSSMGDIQKLDTFYYQNNDIEESYNYTKTYADDDFLWAFQSGILAYQLGEFQKSIDYFNKSEEKFEAHSSDYEINKAFKKLGAIAVNEKIFEYSGSLYEAVLMNYYKALDAIFLRDYNTARVEFNRANDRQRRASDYFASHIANMKDSLAQNNAEFSAEISDIDTSKFTQHTDSILLANYTNLKNFQAYQDYINPFIPYVSGVFFLIQNDFAKAFDLLKQAYAISDTQEILEDIEILQERKKGNKEHYTWILIEEGRIPKKYEFRIDFPLFLFSQNMISLNIALPNLDAGKSFFTHYKLKANGLNNDEYLAFEVSNTANIIINEFNMDLPYIITTSLLSSAYKAYLQHFLSKKIGIFGLLGGAVFSMATTNADIRSARILPLKFLVIKIKNHKNSFSIYANNKMLYNFTINKECKDLCLDTDNLLYLRVLQNKIIPLNHSF